MSKKLSLVGYEVEFIPIECRLNERRASKLSMPPALLGERRKSAGRRTNDLLRNQVFKLLTERPQTA